MNYPRNNYEMSEADLEKLLDAAKPTPVMFLSGGIPMGNSPQENANTAWAELGKKMGFDYMTARPVPGKSQRFFTAVPTETEEQRVERVAREAEQQRQLEIAQLKSTIEKSIEQIEKLTGDKFTLDKSKP